MPLSDPHPPLLLRISVPGRSGPVNHIITGGPKHLMRVIHEQRIRKPQPHIMVLGTLQGWTMRKLQSIDPIGRELTIPPPHLYWHDVEPERWPAVLTDALHLAEDIEYQFQTISRPHFWPDWPAEMP